MAHGVKVETKFAARLVFLSTNIFSTLMLASTIYFNAIISSVVLVHYTLKRHSMHILTDARHLCLGFTAYILTIFKQ